MDIVPALQLQAKSQTIPLKQYMARLLLWALAIYTVLSGRTILAPKIRDNGINLVTTTNELAPGGRGVGQCYAQYDVFLISIEIHVIVELFSDSDAKDHV